ncbi:MAG: VWA domain-containing protein [Candidatus Omnitrophica bacterium]|nr:VWA domain-containing protein [Candidatus Omnitrophota bacterium]
MNDRTKTILLLAVIISVITHLVFFVSSNFMKLSGIKGIEDETMRLFKINRVVDDKEIVKLFESSKKEIPEIKTSGGLQEDAGAVLDKMEFESLHKDKTPVKEDIKLDEVDLRKKQESSMNKEILDSLSSKEKNDYAPDERSLTEPYYSKEEIVTADADRINIVTADIKGDPADKSMRMTVPVTGLKNILKRNLTGGSKEVYNKRKADNYKRIKEYKDMSSFLNIQVSKFSNAGGKDKYFKIEISAKDPASLGSMPKEIIFLIDSSKSMTQEKLEYVKKGIVDCLWMLSKSDRFNIVAFRGDLVKFSPSSVKVTDKALLDAEIFVRELEAVGQTDVEQALLKIVKEEPGMNPSYILLITDGRPTTGEMDSKQIIQEITKRNNMERSIFCFAGGNRINKYLLDFIAYQNRGFTKFAERNFVIQKELINLFKEINDPILTNVRYRLNGLDMKGIYPKNLPDFYMGRNFTIYGTYTTEDIFSMQLLGEMGKDTKELIFQRSLKEALEGEPEIFEKWEFSKKFYLISRESMGESNDSFRD